MKFGLRGSVGLGLFASLLLLGGCSSESPTAPSSGGSGGGTTPPTGANVTVTVSNATPVVSSTTIITATVTQNNQPVPNGTAVEFSTDFGTFTDTAGTTTIRTTTGGVASAVLTSSSAGAATVTVRVNNISRTASVSFRTDTGTGSTRPVITSFTPATSKPSGGTLVTINGANFVAPVRVLFGTKEAAIASVTSSQIQAVVPAINLGASTQFSEVTLTVVTQAGTAGEQTATSSGKFRYELEILTPVVYTVSPASGPNEGNTRISIIGEGFQAPARVFFGTAAGGTGSLTNQVELRVEQVTFGQIIATTPPATGLGAPLRNQQVAMRVLNINSNKEVSTGSAFRYGPAMVITAASNNVQPYYGGGKVRIDGWGFDEPVAVTLAGVGAQVVKVSGTEIEVIASAAALTSCGDLSGPIVVTNIEDAGTANGPDFTYKAVPPSVVSVIPNPSTPGSTIQVRVGGGIVGGALRFSINSKNQLATFVSDNGDGTVTYSLTVPADITFQSQPCGTGNAGTQLVPTSVDLLVTNTGTKCTDTVGITVNPPTLACVIPPVASASPNPLNMGSQPVAGGPSGPQNITITNSAPAGGADLVVSTASSSDPQFVVSGAVPRTIPAGTSQTWSVTFDPSAVGAQTATISFSTNDPNNPTVTVTVNGTGT